MEQETGIPAPLHIVGLGPGDGWLLAPLALAALERSEVIAGYKGYIALIEPSLLLGKHVIATGMTGETARALAALETALAGRESSLVCSGDPGIYALAGLVLEIMEERRISVSALPLNVIPGIPAVCAAAALLGAPLMHDFACISLSDLLTPWPVIQRRLECAYAGDFVVALYNPRSKRRTSQLEEALALARRHKADTTPVGIVTNAFREKQQVSISTLAAIDPEHVDMFTLVLIGNSETRIVPGSGTSPTRWESGARLLTPRGYARKYNMGQEKIE